MDGQPNCESKIHVLLLSDASVLDLAVEGILHQNTAMEVVDPEAGLDDTLHRIRTFTPDVIILNQARQRRDTALLRQCIIDDMPEVRLIVVNVTETSMAIYEGGTCTVRATADLLDAVQLTALESLEVP